MKFKFIYPFIVLWICVPIHLFSQQKTTDAIHQQHALLLKNKNDGEVLKNLSIILLNKGDYDQTVHYAKQLQAVGEAVDNDSYRMYAAIFLGQALMMNGEVDSAKYYLDRSLTLATELKNDSALCSVYNGLGLYAANVDMDYYKSISYFFKGIETAKRISYERLYSILLCNLSGIYYLKNDPIGLKYAQECYELGHSRNDAYLIFSGATNSAYMYYLLKNYDEALEYINEAEFVMTQNGFFDQTNIYNLHGNILFALGDEEAALRYFKKALEYKDQAHTSSIAHTYLSYAKVLIKRKQYADAIPILRQGLEISTDKNNAIYRYKLYESYSEAYELQGDYSNALKYYKIFQRESDSIFNIDKERALSELRVKYDLEKQENEIQQNNLDLLQKEKKIQFMILALVFAVLILGGIYYLYYRKNKLYLQIVKQSQDAIKREKKLVKQIEQLSGNNEKDVLSSEKYSVSSLSDEKSVALYQEINNLMRTRFVYREKDITKEKLADMLNTNRTYLSQVINKQSGLSFTHFINSFRIEEAIHTLSDSENDIPLKALASDLGFNSITTFYKSFQLSVGMTPSLYREKVLELKKRNAN